MDNRADYFLLLADLKRSTDLDAAGSARLFGRLNQALTDWSDACSGDLLAGLDLNYGDEFAGLFVRPNRIYEVVDGVRDALRGYGRFRVAIARGRIGAVSEDTSQMGGPVFKLANDALSSLKSRGQFAQWVLGNPLIDETLSVLTEAGNTLREDMTDYQYRVFQHLRDGTSQREIAAQLGKFEQSVSDAAKRGHADLALQIDQAIDAHLRSMEFD
ncbi:MAG: hypothetical protein AAF253_06355 [Pseudomonadota bacterium]